MALCFIISLLSLSLEDGVDSAHISLVLSQLLKTKENRCIHEEPLPGGEWRVFMYLQDP